MPTFNKINVLASLAKLERYFNKVSMQVAKEAQGEFEAKILDDLIARGHTELATELGEIFHANVD